MSDKPPVKLPDIFYDNRTGQYWMHVPGKAERYLELDGRNAKLHMKKAKFYTEEEDDFGLKSGDAYLLERQLQHSVDYAGPLAGHPIGLYYAPGDVRVLVTSQAKLIPSKPGDFARLENFLGELLPGEQATRFLYWLKIAVTSQRRRVFTPGQMCVFAGEAGCGKSLLQALITELLGGRAAKPYRYMMGKTQFNSDLMGAEHLMIEDENASSSITARREFGASIKDWTVNTLISLHRKGKEAITLPSFHRITLSVNNEPENLMILPPLDPSLMDKMNLFACDRAKVSGDRTKTWNELCAGLPGLLHEVSKMPIPKALRCDRFGVVSYHHPSLLMCLDDISPENRLESLIDQVLFTNYTPDNWVWRGSAEELESELRKSPFAFAIERLLHYSSACGVYMSRLAKKQPARFEERKTRGKKVWLIKAKKEDE